MRIDDKAVVPIGWVLSGFGVVVTCAMLGAFWVAAVNFRLERIEEKLGIPTYHGSSVNPGANEANAGEK